ncbi:MULTISPECIES: hypothetical protein [Chryseobacterium]|uniref:hypothetical protein n=1 Tax=Chryseobacterium TaxID=59732 RepID=UPI000A42AFB9|nr:MULTISPECIES: hypothetical protein [Chryseobacterium]MDH5035704.1 hypothetical protein [Chryseobacterium cucumeris]QWT87988.1 hypothetical protein KBP46_09235 [Chryseobacterium sp. PCH239]RKE72113.1 hypothetical protein DEU39_4789 [Chryseobacterium sp. AG363]WFB67216.1 hypothetical protein PZ898_21245 [Chryseobacterium sp. WX]WNI36326.1 hypothetical protein RHP76_20545 [Chryseobacterium sp. SG20098]
MAIIRKASNIKIITQNKDAVLAGRIHMSTSKKMIFDAIEDNLEFNSAKKIKADGRG